MSKNQTKFKRGAPLRSVYLNTNMMQGSF